MIHLPYLSVARFSGPDAVAFLHAQLSADIEALEPGASTFANYCTPKGQVLGLLLVGRGDDGYRVIAARELLAAIIQRLRIFVMRLKVEIELDPETAVVGLQASDDAAGYSEVFSPPAVAWRYALGDVHNMKIADVSPWKHQELLNAVTWLDSHTTESFIPQMLGFDKLGAVSFSKGCYPGQEIIARTRYLGKVKRQPLIATVRGETGFVSGSRVQIIYGADSVNGTLVDFAAAPEQNTLLFLVTRGVEAEVPKSVVFEGHSYPII